MPPAVSLPQMLSWYIPFAITSCFHHTLLLTCCPLWSLSNQMQKMTNATVDMWAQPSHYCPRSRSPPHAGTSRRQHHSHSPRSRKWQPKQMDRCMQDNMWHIKAEVFQPGAGPRGRVCAVCLSRHDHAFTKCDNAKLRDGSLSSAQKESGRLVSTNGLLLCFNWQVPRGCRSTGHSDFHLCSGCRKADHGAQGCSQAEKLWTTYPVCQGLAGPWYARRERGAVDQGFSEYRMVQWF